MSWIEYDIPDCMNALPVPQITAVHTSNAGNRWATRGHGRFAGDDEKIKARGLFDMLTFRPDYAIRFLSALKEQEWRARTQGQLGSPMPPSPVMQRDRPACAVRIPKQAVRPGEQA